MFDKVYRFFRRKNKTKLYRQRLGKAFPKALHADLETVLDVLPLNNYLIALRDGTEYTCEELIHSSEFQVKLEGELLTIPQRVYFAEPTPALENALTDRQRNILHCIYTRHHDGYLRERRVKEMPQNELEAWMIPFLVQLMGEYVYELLPAIDKTIHENTLHLYVQFKDENPDYWQRTEKRIVSYWNEYYKYRFPKLKNYLGVVMMKRIKAWSSPT